MPGFFRTRLLEAARGPDRALEGARRVMQSSGLEAHEVAEAMLSAAARGHTHFVHPLRYLNYWRLKRLMPQRFQSLMPKLLARGVRRQ